MGKRSYIFRPVSTIKPKQQMDVTFSWWSKGVNVLFACAVGGVVAYLLVTWIFIGKELVTW